MVGNGEERRRAQGCCGVRPPRNVATVAAVPTYWIELATTRIAVAGSMFVVAQGHRLPGRAMLLTRHQKFTQWAFLALIVTSLVLIVLSVRSNRQLDALLDFNRELRIGDKAYTFKAATVGGVPVDLRRRSSLLVFFNTRCPSCRKALGMVQEVQTMLSSHGIQVIGICRGTLQTVSSFIRTEGVTFPVIADTTGRIFSRYSVRAVPGFILVDDRAKIAYCYKYDVPVREMLASLPSYLKRNPKGKQ